MSLALPIAYSLVVQPGKVQYGYRSYLQKKKAPRKIPASTTNSGIVLKHPTLDKTAICKYEMHRAPQLLKDTSSSNKFVVKIDFMEIEFQQNIDSATIGFSQKLPPVSFQGELDENLSTIDIPIEYQLQQDSVTIKYYFADFTNIRERLNNFIRACSVFYTVFCQQPSLKEQEDGSLEVKWS